MAKEIKSYNNVMFESVRIEYTGDKQIYRDALVGEVGELTIFESEHKNPGKKYVVFTTEFEYFKTSLGDIEEDNNTIRIYTHDRKNVYSFRLNWRKQA